MGCIAVGVLNDALMGVCFQLRCAGAAGSCGNRGRELSGNLAVHGIYRCAIFRWSYLVVLPVAFCLALMMVATNHRNASAMVINA